jgi:hypothetical protein
MKRIATAKSRSKKTGTIQPALVGYRRFLEDCMLAASTIELHLNRVKLFLQWAGTDTPSMMPWPLHFRISLPGIPEDI